MHSLRTPTLVLAQLAPVPTPLTGSQIRVDRIARAIAEATPSIFYCISSVDTQTVSRDWTAASMFREVRSFQRNPLAAAHDPLWGSAWRTVASALPHQVPPTHMRHWSDGLVRSLRSFRESNPVVWAFRSWIAEMAREAGLTRIIVDVDDFEANVWREQLRFRRPSLRDPFHRLQLNSLTRYERHLPSRFSRVIVTKESDRDFLEIGNPAHVITVANGVDPVSRAKVASGFNMLFVGALNWHVNATAALWFAEQVLPLVRQRESRARFVAVGRGPVDDGWRSEMIRLGADVIESPRSLEPHYADAAVVVIPLRSGGGTSLKAAEAFSQGIPVVSTKVGVRGFPVVGGQHFICAETAEEFAEACCRSMSNPESLMIMSARSKTLVDGEFSWSRLSLRAAECVLELQGDQR